MVVLRPFRALRPRPEDAAQIAAVPYDVVTTEEARLQADDNPLSFLRVTRADLESAAGADPFDAAVYERAVQNFERLKKTALLVEDEPSLYLYRLRSGAHEQTGVAGCFSLEDYDEGVVKKHERTRRDKEDDRTRHMLALGAQTGPAFLVYRSQPAVDALGAAISKERPLFDFEARDGVRHTIWSFSGRPRDQMIAAFGDVPALYIADGHHRVASAARARTDIRDAGLTRTSLGDEADFTTFLGVAFPHNQAQILSYNRIVKDLGELSPADLLQAVAERFDVGPGPASPARRGDISMYFQGSWQTLRRRTRTDSADPVRSLDVSILQEHLLEPILNIRDIRTDKRIDFVGGARGTSELERLVTAGEAVLAFSLFPVSVEELMQVSDSGEIMPPKSTWFEPKLRDGLLIHLI
jgi:uncharacterized protein (DUF1015 family)